MISQGAFSVLVFDKFDAQRAGEAFPDAVGEFEFPLIEKRDGGVQIAGADIVFDVARQYALTDLTLVVSICGGIADTASAHCWAAARRGGCGGRILGGGIEGGLCAHLFGRAVGIGRDRHFAPVALRRGKVTGGENANAHCSDVFGCAAMQQTVKVR